MVHTDWYKDTVFYQIWPRSFRDGNGDGMGDLYGVIQSLDYIKSLGCDGLWFSPLYPSPGVDCGYDISDYQDIDSMFGGMEAFDACLAAAHAKGMKVIMDLVINHTSDEHEWFQKSRRRIEPYTDYYIWRPMTKDGRPPNNWDSHFEGKAWTFDPIRKEYYLHLFTVKQPDLNMDNPLVRQEVKKIMRFWLDKGVDGFREDVVTFISKKEGLPDDRLLPVYKGLFHYNHGPHIHEYLTEFRDQVLCDYDCMTLAEAPMVTPGIALKYIQEGPKKEIDMMIQNSAMCADCLFQDFFPLKFSLRRLKRAFRTWQERLDNKAWNMLFLENHDHPRIISRYGSEQFREQSGKMLAACYLFQKGTPFIYQGQEIGMVNWHPSSAEEYEDVATKYYYDHCAQKLTPRQRLHRLWRCSRDSSRTLMQWDGSPNAGFTTGTPWFAVNENYKEINVAEQNGRRSSVLNFYRLAIGLRKKLSCVRWGTYQEYGKRSRWLYQYSMQDARQKILVVCSFSDRQRPYQAPKEFYLERGKLILCNYDEPKPNVLQPYETRVYFWN